MGNLAATQSSVVFDPEPNGGHLEAVDEGRARFDQEHTGIWKRAVGGIIRESYGVEVFHKMAGLGWKIFGWKGMQEQSLVVDGVKKLSGALGFEPTLLKRST
jgi:hypothetical protein